MRRPDRADPPRWQASGAGRRAAETQRRRARLSARWSRSRAGAQLRMASTERLQEDAIQSRYGPSPAATGTAMISGSSYGCIDRSVLSTLGYASEVVLMTRGN